VGRFTGPTVSPSAAFEAKAPRAHSQRFLPRPQRITCFFYRKGRVLGSSHRVPANPRANGVYDVTARARPRCIKIARGRRATRSMQIRHLHTRVTQVANRRLGAAASVVRSSRSTNFATRQVPRRVDLASRNWRTLRHLGPPYALTPITMCTGVWLESSQTFRGITQENLFLLAGVALSMLRFYPHRARASNGTSVDAGPVLRPTAGSWRQPVA